MQRLSITLVCLVFPFVNGCGTCSASGTEEMEVTTYLYDDEIDDYLDEDGEPIECRTFCEEDESAMGTFNRCEIIVEDDALGAGGATMDVETGSILCVYDVPATCE